MKIECLYQDESDTGHEPAIVGSEANHHIVMIGAWRRQMTSFEVFQVDKSFYFVDDECGQNRLLAGSPDDIENLFRFLAATPADVMKVLQMSWQACHTSVRRKIFLNWIKRLIVPVLVVILGFFWFANLRVTKIALAPTIQLEDRRREFVYLALDEYFKRYPVQNETAVRPVAKLPVETKKPILRSHNESICRTVIEKPKLDKDVQKFLAPKFAKRMHVRTRRCL